MSDYVDLTGQFTYKKLTAWTDFDALAENDQYLKDNGWQTGTIAQFLQAAAPTGWTKQTTVNDKLPRIVSGSTGGTTGGSVATSSGIGLAHTHSIASAGAHTHNIPNHQHLLERAQVSSLNPFIVGGWGGSTSGGNFFGTKAMISLVGTTFSGTIVKDRTGVNGGGGATSSAGSHDHGGATNSGFAPIVLAYCDMLFCAKDASSGYTNLTAAFVHSTRHVYERLEELAANDEFNRLRLTPTGSVSIFGTATSPAGWTKGTSIHDRTLRIVSGTGGGQGGSQGINNVITLAHTHTIPDATHTHTIPNHIHELGKGNGQSYNTGTGIGKDGSGFLRSRTGASFATFNSVAVETDSNGGGGNLIDDTHNHGGTGSGGTNITLAYLNVIQATKQSTGAPWAYTDMQGFFTPATDDPEDAPLLAYQDLRTMGRNDAHIFFHTMESDAVMFFYQQLAPLTWTKLTTHDDLAQRIVSDATGGASGGSHGPGQEITLVHTHPISSYVHHHGLNNHVHSLREFSSNDRDTLTAYGHVDNAQNEIWNANQGGGSTVNCAKATTQNDGSGYDTTDDSGHDHGGVTGSAGVNVTLAYADVIQCRKN